MSTWSRTNQNRRMSDSGAAIAQGPTGRLVKNFRQMVPLSSIYIYPQESSCMHLHFATPTSMSYMEAECANMVPIFGIYSTTKLSLRRNPVMILSKGKSSYGMATPEEETISTAATASAAEEVATMTGSATRKVFFSPPPPCPSERQKSKKNPKPNEFASPRLPSIKDPPRAGVSPVGRRSRI